jgi:hypothetical protein
LQQRGVLYARAVEQEPRPENDSDPEETRLMVEGGDRRRRSDRQRHQAGTDEQVQPEQRRDLGLVDGGTLDRDHGKTSVSEKAEQTCDHRHHVDEAEVGRVEQPREGHDRTHAEDEEPRLRAYPGQTAAKHPSLQVASRDIKARLRRVRTSLGAGGCVENRFLSQKCHHELEHVEYPRIGVAATAPP